MTRCPHAAERGAGFTLIEVVVALVLLSLVLSSAYQIFSTGMQRAGDLEDRSRALVIAQSQLALASVGENFQLGGSAGESEDRRFRWNVTIAEFEDGVDPAKRVQQTFYPVRVSVHVAWVSGAAQERSFDLSSLVLGKVAP